MHELGPVVILVDNIDVDVNGVLQLVPKLVECMSSQLQEIKSVDTRDFSAKFDCNRQIVPRPKNSGQVHILNNRINS